MGVVVGSLRPKWSHVRLNMSQMETLEQVKEYYGKTLRCNDDLKTGACCTSEAMPEHIRQIVRQIEPEVTKRFYGCGSPIPPMLDGCTVLDLGCGTGRDCFVISRLVGEKGRVVGVDMTEAQLDVARRNLDAQMNRFGYKKPNVEFIGGYIEDLAGIGIADNSVDVVVSNCVINLSPDKPRVFAEIMRVLKPGGELYFSDVFASRRVPEALRSDPVLLGECLGGAMYIEDFRRLLARLGCPDYRVVQRSRVVLKDAEVIERAGMIDFHSMTVRAFKLTALEDRCEDFGQMAVYRGSIPRFPHAFDLDDHHRFFTGKPMLVCGNTAAMLSETRFGPHFAVHGDRSTHFGMFECSPAAVADEDRLGIGGACC